MLPYRAKASSNTRLCGRSHTLGRSLATLKCFSIRFVSAIRTVSTGVPWNFVFVLDIPEGRHEISDSPPPPPSGISGLQFNSTLLPFILFFCLQPLLFLSCLFFCLLAHSRDFFLPENSLIFFVMRWAF